MYLDEQAKLPAEPAHAPWGTWGARGIAAGLVLLVAGTSLLAIALVGGTVDAQQPQLVGRAAVAGIVLVDVGAAPLRLVRGQR